MSSVTRRKLLAANWKMHFMRAQALEYLQVFRERVHSITQTEIVLAPPFTLLETVGRALQHSQIKLAAQNLCYEREGAFTGEVSAAMLKDLGCAYVLIGHSERRRLLGETDSLIQKKLQAALEAGLVPMLCVGESLEERRAQKTETVLQAQLRGAFDPHPAFGHPLPLRERDGVRVELVIAYEPVWAIGTGVNAEPAQAQASAHFIREMLRSLLGEETSQGVHILYGGSVKVSNLEGFLREPDIDGALVGGVSLDPVAFADMVQQTEKDASA